ncbi:MAG: hypothetical protein U9Q37_06305 [Euryarchaeota archaeon]|nr:hypothetical protein [Euryarchaeota archaeon]
MRTMRTMGFLLILLLVGSAALSGCTNPDKNAGLQQIQAKTQITSDSTVDAVAGEGSAEISLPVAPASERVDLYEPSFSDPTNATNPLLPVSELDQVILLGRVDGFPFRVVATLLPGTKTIEWNGQQVETLESQYVAFLDGRIHEVALDWYAQDDKGAVWYFGEDVFNYEDGVIADTDGTWLAGRDGPVAMIMPGDPRVGDVYRPENIPGTAFEEVTVRSINETMHGPRGHVNGSIIVEELHMDGTYEDKIFAPGYGEFLVCVEGELEAVALAVPTDALSGTTPAELVILSTGAADTFDASQSGDWNAASASVDAMIAAWDMYQAGDVPRMLDAQMSNALVVLVAAVDARQPEEARQAAIDVARACLDLQLQYRPPAEIDLARFDLCIRQIMVDIAADDPGAVKGDIATLGWIWDRIAYTPDSGLSGKLSRGWCGISDTGRTDTQPGPGGKLSRGWCDSSDISRIDTRLDDLRAAADVGDLTAAADRAAKLRDALTGFEVENGDEGEDKD